MLIDKENLDHYLKKRNFKIKRKADKESIRYAYYQLDKHRIIVCRLWGTDNNICNLEAKINWNSKEKCYSSIPSLTFSFYFPIDHTHLDNRLKDMVRWTTYARQERREGRFGIY